LFWSSLPRNLPEEHAGDVRQSIGWLQSGVAHLHLEFAGEQQNVQQSGALKVAQMLLAQADVDRAVRTFRQKFSRRHPLGGVEGPAASQCFEGFQPIVTTGKKMVEAEILPREQDDR